MAVQVKSPSKVVGDKQTTTNIRYKHGRNLQYEPKEVLSYREPNDIGLPKPNFNSTFIFRNIKAIYVTPITTIILSIILKIPFNMAVFHSKRCWCH